MKTLKKPSVSQGELILVNAEHPCIEVPSSLVPVNDEVNILIERPAAALIERLISKIRGWGDIIPVSGWRSDTEQQKIWDDSIANNGEEFTRKYVAIPGHSEHQTGLAIDLGLRQKNIDFIRPEFPYYGICQVFRENAAHYGFIQRYPENKESITGIAHEPWHFRYVGIPHAEIIRSMGITLEEYHSFLRENTDAGHPFVYRHGMRLFEITYISVHEEMPLEAEGSAALMVSGTNTDGYIVTNLQYGDL